jgi:hypothetical protein
MEIIPLPDPIPETPQTSQGSFKRAGAGRENEEWKIVGMWRGSGGLRVLWNKEDWKTRDWVTR